MSPEQWTELFALRRDLSNSRQAWADAVADFADATRPQSMAQYEHLERAVRTLLTAKRRLEAYTLMEGVS
jgi:hypothetical protein